MMTLKLIIDLLHHSLSHSFIHFAPVQYVVSQLLVMQKFRHLLLFLSNFAFETRTLLLNEMTAFH